MQNQYVISTDKSLLNVTAIHDFLSNRSYWAKGRSRATVQTAIDHSLCFGLYLNGEQLAFTRVVTDCAVFAYLMDVVVFEPYRGQGLGKLLLAEVLAHPQLQSVNWLLRTLDAQSLYEHFGFKPAPTDMAYMSKAALA
ncbi:GNAT family N-acetyltransferase [Pseudoalteromonas fenneropenaei]|uniref:GNAT family N-acetyltransferase n=1 Tax=Pseudoalteromonas fenneropenaei TaxID=1737459 RepID=A0ABV7CJM5_9GAMM